MYKKKFQDIELSRLGMGNMRLPQLDDKDPHSPIDLEKSQEIIDYAMNHGINYYDTAYVYNAGDSERTLGKCVKKYNRDSFYIADKYFILGYPDYKAVFEEQLERLQTDHIDFYLCHCLMDGNVDTYLESGCIDYFLEMKKQGKIRYLGFSSHAGLAALEKFANHHQWDFAQLQINYYDWNYEETAKEYQILKDRNIPVMVMEPVRGGKLAQLTPEAEKILRECHPDWSDARWALKFVQSLDGVQVILSGMSTLDQIIDNVNTFDKYEPLTQQEHEALQKACEVFRSQIHVPCTACRYCCEGCPMAINIPEYLKFYNAYKVDGEYGLSGIDKVESEGKPYDCIGCGNCTGHCPQSIDTPTIMSELGELMKKHNL